MADLTLVTGNRLERLVEALAEVVAQPVSDPLIPDIIVVQSKGMERWVRMALARINGICANAAFPFPKAFLEDVCRKCFSDYLPSSLVDPDVLTFRILDRIDTHCGNPAFEPLRVYLQDDTDPLKCYGISRRIAHLFDQYLVFRPDMVFSWESGKDTDWQAVLWRDLTGDPPHFHPAYWMKRLAEKIRKERVRLDAHFHRVCVFGISYLPPAYLEVLAQVSRQIPVFLFLMNPCREYWSDIVSDFQAQRIQADYAAAAGVKQDLHMERGNRLLSAWGTQGKQFFSAVSALEAGMEERFQEPGGRTLLSGIQSDILALRDPEVSMDPDVTFHEPKPVDCSIRVHACHSPMREMEVLRDLILDLFESEPGLSPRDILVMAPDIEVYAPFIQAVFGQPVEGDLRIPFHIADRGAGAEGEAVAAFLSILSLYDTRMEAAQVLEILDYTPVQRRFGLSGADVRTIGQWIRDTGIRWGIDAADRRRWKVPGFFENTWEAGVERLLLGYAMAGDDDQDVAGILPYGRISGETASVLASFTEFFDHLVFVYNEFHNLKNIEGWIYFLNQLVEGLMDIDAASDPGGGLIREAMQRLQWAGNQAEFRRKLDFSILRAFMEGRLKRKTEGRRFASEGVTFCTLLPMRSIPAQVICLVGMNDGAFPREDFSVTFDRMARHPRAGDRSRRRDDQYLFLEALLSARQRLYITYVGRSLQDNSPLAPSVLVTQLLEYLRLGYGIPENELVVQHPLHPFSSAYFQGDPALFSYSRGNFTAATKKNTVASDASFFIDAPLRDREPELLSVDLEALCRFISHPAAYFLRERLGIFLLEEEALFSDREPFSLEGLEAYQLAGDLIEAHLNGISTETVFRTWRLGGRLPHGNVGRVQFYRAAQAVASFSNTLKALFEDIPPETVSGEMAFGDRILTGKVEGVRKGRLFRYRYAKTQGKDLLDTWVRYLFLKAVSPEALNGAVYLAKDGGHRFLPVKDASSYLEPIIDLYRTGRSAPVPLFPRSSYEYACQRFQKGRSRKEALEKALQKWTGNDFIGGDSRDPAIERCFGKTAPLGEAFERTAESVFSPLLAHLAKET